MELEHRTDGLREILGLARQYQETRMWLGPLVGRTGDNPGPYVTVEDLESAISGSFEPKVVIHWDEDKTLSVKKLDGGVMATFELKF